MSAANKVRRGDIRHAVVVRTKKKWQRSDGSVVRFDDNACVLISKAGEPIGSRLNGEFLIFPVAEGGGTERRRMWGSGCFWKKWIADVSEDRHRWS